MKKEIKVRIEDENSRFTTKPLNKPFKQSKAHKRYEYKQRVEKANKRLKKLWKYGTWLAIGLSLLIVIFFWSTMNSKANDIVRSYRMDICEEAYNNNKDWVDSRYKHKDQDIVKRCATYMTLIYAFESNYGQSYKCTQHKNCYWLKGNWVDTPAWFLIFNTHQAWDRYFALKYMQWHFNKNIYTFVHNWSMTDQKVYTKFVQDRYWNIYNNLK